MKVGYFWCSKGHVYSFGDEDWHSESHAHQFISDDTFNVVGVPIPRYCPEEFADGEPCMDSVSIVGPFVTVEEAQASYDNRGDFYR